MSDKVKQLYPNNQPTRTTVEEQEKKGWALRCSDKDGPFGIRLACFVNIFGVHQDHFIPNEHP